MQRWYRTLALLCLGAYLCSCRTANASSNPTVTIASGRVRGLTLKSAREKDFYAFRGIPYAKSTAGSRRFKPPHPVADWDDVFDATRFGPECPQFNFITRGVEGTEDCLAINVYTPQLPASSEKQRDLKPVLVFIHGGGFMVGTGSYSFYGAERFVDYSVVLVTFNYRLGVLGFLSTGDEASPGNYGMLDQVLALRWVKKNIANFGGDPEKVTIFGESAGGASVTYHLLSPLSKGLFQRAIVQSGSALNHWALQKHPLRYAREVANMVDCPTNDTRKLVDCFGEKSVYELVRKPFNLQISSMFPIFFAPVVEPPHKHRGFLTEDPYHLFKSGKIANKVPLILGITELEIYSFFHDLMKHYHYKGKEHLDKELHTLLPFLFHMPSNDASVYKRIFKEYFGDFKLDEEKIEEIHMQLLSDACFGVGVAQNAELYSLANISTWTYVYSHVGQHAYSVTTGTPPGKYASHADELFLQFPFFYAKLVELNQADGQMSRTINSLWTNFAKGEDLSIKTNGKEIQWKHFDNKKPHFLRLNLQPKMERGQLVDKYKFWTETLPSLTDKSTMKG